MPLFSHGHAEPSIITLGDRARDAGQWELAVRLYRKALDRNPSNRPIWVQYGHALKESGKLRDPDKLAQAEIAYRAALSLDPDVADSHLQLGHVLKVQGKIEEAQAAYLKALALDFSLNDASFELMHLGWKSAHLSELRRITGMDVAETVDASSGTATPVGQSNGPVSVGAAHVCGTDSNDAGLVSDCQTASVNQSIGYPEPILGRRIRGLCGRVGHRLGRG